MAGILPSGNGGAERPPCPWFLQNPTQFQDLQVLWWGEIKLISHNRLEVPMTFFFSSVQFSSVQSLSCVWLFATPWTAVRQAFLSITNFWSLFKLIFTMLMMPSDHLILCCPHFLLPSIIPSIRVFSNESVLHMRWPKYWGFSFSITPSNEHLGLISFRMDCLDPLAV